MSAADAPRSSRLAHLALALVSFALLAAAFPPVDQSALVFVALVPWLVGAALLGPRGFLLGYAAGSLLYGAWLLLWIAQMVLVGFAADLGWIAVSLIYLLSAWPFGWWLGRLVATGRRLGPTSVTLAFLAQEVVREYLIGGVTWHSPGYALAEWTTWIQVADLAGVWPLSALVYATNVVLADVVLTLLGRGPGLRRLGARLATVGALAAAIYGYGVWRIEAIAPLLVEGPALIGIQPNVPQGDKEGLSSDARADRREEIRQQNLDLMAAGAAEFPEPDLVVWPETSFTSADDASPERRRGVPLVVVLSSRRRASGLTVAEEFARALRLRGAAPRTRYLLGLFTRDDLPPGLEDEGGDGVRERNTALLVEHRDRGLAPVERYDKRELAPFGETIPFRGVLPFRAELREAVRRSAGFAPAMTPGVRNPVFRIGSEQAPARFTTTICFEIVFPELFVESRNLGADFHVNISNDAWYGGSSELDLVHRQTKFRAVETRLSVFRVSNTGISTLIDPLGREVRTVTRDGQRKEVPGVLAARVPLGGPPPPIPGGRRLTGWLVLILWGLAFLRWSVFKRR